MPTISEPVDEDIRRGKATSILEHYQSGVHGEATASAALRILRYDADEIRNMLAVYAPPEHRRVRS